MGTFTLRHLSTLCVCVCVCKKNKPAGWDFVLGLCTAGLGKLLGHDKPLGVTISQIPRRVALCRARAWTRSQNLVLVPAVPRTGSVTLSKVQVLPGL